MKVPLSWLREYVDANESLEALAERLDMAGLVVESIAPFGDDRVIDIELTPNRADCMSLMGVAREVSVLTGAPLREPAVDLVEDAEEAASLAAVEIKDRRLCPRYVARMILDVQVGPSPAWLRRRLEAAGVRAISNIVDVTNYVMLEVGQPLHAFDYDRLHGGRIVVRRARKGERLVTLDEVERILEPDMLVIADADRAVALAGVIGGLETEISAGTRRVLLEAAYFDPISVRRTSKRLGLRTEASARFERGVDPNGTARAAARACALLREVAGGRVLRGAVDVYPRPIAPRQISLRPSRIPRLLGVEVPAEEVEDILRRLGCQVQRGRGRVLKVVAPTVRPDLVLEEDLIEEVARIRGYDGIPTTLPTESAGEARRDPRIDLDDVLRTLLTRSGLMEVHTYTLTHPQVFDRLRLPAAHPLREAAALRNPLVEDHAILRTTLLPGLLQVLGTNASRGTEDVHVFEIGRVFQAAGGRDGSGPVVERREVAVAMMGRMVRGAWNLKAEEISATFYHVKGVVEAVLRDLVVAEPRAVPARVPWLHPGRAAAITVEEATVASFGEVHPDVARAYDLPGRAYVALVDLQALLDRRLDLPRLVRDRRHSALPKYPPVHRDLAVIVAAGMPAAEVEAVIQGAAGPLLEHVEVFDVYQGPPVPAGHKNLAYSLTFRAPDRTLEAGEVDAVMVSVRAAVEQRLQAQIRGW